MTRSKLLSGSHNSPERRLERFAPFHSMGVKVLELGRGGRDARILLPLNRHNCNPGGSMFGGAIAALADPVPALACNRIFPGYSVWTRQLQIDFRRPGVADLELRFDFPPGIEMQIGEELERIGRSSPLFEFGLYLPGGEVCAWVQNRVA
ncbi:hypothetical protein QQ73_19470, partial [Candidatus Endoriftia persephone str. Guaymas]|nr:hypothetical protein [Candidatus Endoriftia persephone str. Guaymas]